MCLVCSRQKSEPTLQVRAQSLYQLQQKQSSQHYHQLTQSKLPYGLYLIRPPPPPPLTGESKTQEIKDTLTPLQPNSDKYHPFGAFTLGCRTAPVIATAITKLSAHKWTTTTRANDPVAFILFSSEFCAWASNDSRASSWAFTVWGGAS
jgi:hypothetical protein